MKNRPEENEKQVNRREFLKGGSVASLMALMGGVQIGTQIKAQAEDKPNTVGAKVKCGVIGLGNWGRDIVATLSRIPEADVAVICDNYGPFLRRAARSAPEAKAVENYKDILDDKEIIAIVVATPSHQHREIVEAALQAGKHVYCEAPLAHTVEDARAIAQAAKNAHKQVFQTGLQARSDLLRLDLLRFIRAGAMGKTLMARSQWHKKHSWRQASPNPDREQELNWRLRRETSPGLIGEIGIHQIDAANWFLRELPVAVSGFGGILHWRDGRQVPDTAQAVIEYPNGVQFMQDTTLANSFDADYEMYYGTDSAIMVRENKAWMFKEVDSPLLGWEVYARKDLFYKETGIALVANATKLVAQGNNPVQASPYENTPLFYALQNFLVNANEIQSGVEDFSATFNPNDKAALQEYLADLKLQPTAGYQEGLEATIVALKANEAILKKQRIEIKKEWFELA